MKKILKLSALTVILLSSLSTEVMASENYQPDIANGAQVWEEVCMRCHNLRGPADLSRRAWRYSMNHMRVRAGLTGHEEKDILAFILSSKTAEDNKL